VEQPAPRQTEVVVTEITPDITSPRWEAERDEVAQVLVRVLLRARERLIREGLIEIEP
jgi:hypothetical protein